MGLGDICICLCVLYMCVCIHTHTHTYIFFSPNMMGHMNLTGLLFKSRTRGVGVLVNGNRILGFPLGIYPVCIACVCVWGGVCSFILSIHKRGKHSLCK